jgi:hypothetical protein
MANGENGSMKDLFGTPDLLVDIILFKEWPEDVQAFCLKIQENIKDDAPLMIFRDWLLEHDNVIVAFAINYILQSDRNDGITDSIQAVSMQGIKKLQDAERFAARKLEGTTTSRYIKPHYRNTNLPTYMGEFRRISELHYPYSNKDCDMKPLNKYKPNPECSNDPASQLATYSDPLQVISHPYFKMDRLARMLAEEMGTKQIETLLELVQLVVAAEVNLSLMKVREAYAKQQSEIDEAGLMVGEHLGRINELEKRITGLELKVRTPQYPRLFTQEN